MPYNCKHQSISIAFVIALLLVTLPACKFSLGKPDSVPTEGARIAPSVTAIVQEMTRTTQAEGGNAAPAETPKRRATVVPATALPKATSRPAARATVTLLPKATVTPKLTTGRVNGRMYYPSSDIPAMTLYFENRDSGKLHKVAIKESQKTYSVDLPSGVYFAYAWLPDFTLGGAYTTCNENNACDAHDLVEVTVQTGQTTDGIDIYDWYAPDTMPLPPGAEPLAGAIHGVVHFPGSYIPAMTVYARNVDTDRQFTLEIEQDSSDFQFENLPIGFYHVFAWTESDGKLLGGSFSVAVLCGLTVDCTDHEPLAVKVVAQQTSTDVDVADWYAQESVPKP